ncbi:copper resistance protein B [Caulobacter sp. NIBR2454]|uniref:copper resistance protein B n=1 Tax=Caulobacter sp. NIBR2454 TaxID=3015996 RepID=UPI0022B7320C|nr:copper resistance protein B [Caulobacter sp. NIBR2454]
MKHLLLLTAFIAEPVMAQSDPHAGHVMTPAPVAPAEPHAGHSDVGHDAPPWAASDPHAGHDMSEPAQPAPDPHAGHDMGSPPADPHAGHSMPAADPHAAHMIAPPPATEPAPPPPTDFAAERFYDPKVMAAARAQLRREHGDVRWTRVMLETAEYRPASGQDGYGWEGQASFGGDINRFVVTSEGEGAGDELESAEIQALYSRAIGPYFNLQAGVRHDFEPGPSLSYATIGVDGLAPYWFEVSGALFLSEDGDLSARLEGSYDLRLTQKLILEPRAELDIAAQDVSRLNIGSGLSSGEFGLRLRYAFRPEIAPYVGVLHERKFGDTADLARAHGEDARSTRMVIGLRAWF